MKFKKLTNASSPKIGLLRHSSGENKTSNFKRSKSLRASVKLMTKIRSQPCSSTRIEKNLRKINSNSNKDEENIHNMSRLKLSNNFGVDLPEGLENSKKIVEDFEERVSSKPARIERQMLKERINEHDVVARNDEFSAYENPAFTDISFDSSFESFYHENEFEQLEKHCDVKLAQKAPEKAGSSNTQIDNGLTVIMKNEHICKIHKWCTRVKKHSAKQFFQSTKEHKNNILTTNTQEANKHVNHKVSLNQPTKKVQKDTKDSLLKTTNNTPHPRKEIIEDRCMHLKVKNNPRLILQENALDAKSHTSQAMEFLEGLSRRKAPQRNLYQHDKLSSANVNLITIPSSYGIHLHVLFTAVEQGYIDRVRAILESTDIEINSLNNDSLSSLDVAVLNNNRLLAKMLITFGAQEGNQFKSPGCLKNHLALLLSESERRLQELGGTINSSGFSGVPLLEPSSSHTHRGSFSSQHSNLTGCGGNAEEKQLASWERRARMLKKMLVVFDQIGPPDLPLLVTVDVIGTTSVTVKFHESDLPESPLCTKFKLQWSLTEDFSDICSERDVFDVKLKECRIEGLTQGQKYFFRAAAGNIKGYSKFKPTTPPYLIPSSWRDVDGRTARFEGRLEQLDNLFCDVRGPEFCHETPALQRRNYKKKTTIKQLFTASSKFQKNLRRGIFLSCVLYNEDKILVTNEDFLPVIEIDETYPSLIHQDFHWLMKVTCSWDDVKSLRQDMEKSQNSSTNQFRIKILQAVTQMQAALCIQDLGQLYHKPVRDVQGTLVFSTVNQIRSSKLVSMLNSKWLPLSKIIKKLTVHEDSNVADMLMASIQDQVNYHQVSSIKLSKGLYLGYFKLQSSVDSIQVVVPAKSPNILPHCKIRDNPHVSAEEWEYLKRIAELQISTVDNENEENENTIKELQGSEQQKIFIDTVAATAKRLFNYMEISADELLIHRIYNAEVIDLTSEVSFLIVVPPFETACSAPGSREILLQRNDFLSLPIQVFEMIHFNTYQKDVTNRYFRLSCILELDTAQAQHSHREAFSTSELTIAKDKLDKLKEFQLQMNSVWKGARWLIDVITFARDKTSAGISVKHLLSVDRNKNRHSCNSLKRSLLQLPPRDPKLVKSSPGRGSWPGPTATDSTYTTDMNLLSTEFSKSEQQLPMGLYSRKNSSSSHCSSASEPHKPVSVPGSSCISVNLGNKNHLGMIGGFGGHMSRLPPSKSEDMLVLGKYRHIDPSTSASATSSPLLSIKLIESSVSNTTSESIHSISSDECPVISSVPLPAVRLKSAKSTASVAAIAADRKIAENQSDESSVPILLPGILQVYAAYETGLASGTSLKLHVTPRTTAREVVDLVVKQLNMAVVLKGLEGPVYSAEELSNFCLVAVIGARERCLRDDFKPLQLQNPWKKGRLYVRQKQDVLAALEHSSKHSAYL